MKALVLGMDGSATSKMGSDLATLTGVLRAFSGKLSSYREASLSQSYICHFFSWSKIQRASHRVLMFRTSELERVK